MKYQTLAELQHAFLTRELNPDHPHHTHLTLDNDTAYVYANGECVYRSDPWAVLTTALEMLDIPWEPA